MNPTLAAYAAPERHDAPVSALPFVRQHGVSGALIVLAHALALWALTGGLSQRSTDLVVPVVALAQILDAQAATDVKTATLQARPGQPPSQQRTPPAPLPRPALAQPAAAAVVPAPMRSTPAPQAPAAPAATSMTNAAAVQATTPQGAPVVSNAPLAQTSPARVELPSSTADYLNNPKPAYPPASKRMGEQGLVVVRVLIGTDGRALRAEIRQSSGFERLDQAALATTLKWRYVPGKRGGQPEALWFNVPIHFVLE